MPLAYKQTKDLKRLFATVRAASSRGSAKAKLFMEDMIQIGEDVHAQRNHRLTQIMQLPMQDQRRAVYALLRVDTPFCPPAGRVREQSPWNPFDGLPRHASDLSKGTAACVVGIHVVHHVRGAHVLLIPLDGSGGTGLQPMDRVLDDLGLSCVPGALPYGVCTVLDHGTWYRGRYEALTVRVNLGSRCSQTVWLLEASWVGPVKWCWSSSNQCATSQFWQWPLCLMWGRCGCMTGSCGESFQRRRGSGPWLY